MYKENIEVLTYDYEKIKVNAETHAVVRNRTANFYFDCSKCEKQNKNGQCKCYRYNKIVALETTRSGKNKIYCTNYKRVKNG